MEIVLSGSVAFDYLMTFPGYFRDHILPEKLHSISLSFLVDSMTVLRGGVAPNIAYSLALLGGRPRLMAAVGEDFSDYRAWLEARGVDTRGARVIPGVNTASFFANTDRSNAQIASFYPGAMGHAAELLLRDLPGERPDLVVVSPNDPAAMRRNVEECLELGIPYFYDPSQQLVRLPAEEIRQGVEGARALFCNDYEAGLIEKSTGLGLPEILKHVEFAVITRGEHGADIFTRQGVTRIPVVTPTQIADPTGVGDAFRGGFLAGYGRGWRLELCGQMGALAATYCLEQNGPQGHQYTRAEFVARFRRHFDDGGLLDALLLA